MITRRPFPLVKEADIHPELFLAHAEMETHHWWFVARREVIGRIIGTLVQPIVEPQLVVDIGCGTGGTSRAFALRYRYLGIDPSESAISIARQTYPDGHFICGQVPADLPEEARQARIFLLTDVLEHVEDDFGFLRSVVDVMRPGASLLITVPADPALWSQHDVDHAHFRRYVPRTLFALFDGLPVAVEMWSYFNARLYPVVRAIRTMWRLLPRHRRLGDLRMPPRPVNAVLRWLLAGEGRRLLAVLGGNATARYPRGVSMIALLTRDD